MKNFHGCAKNHESFLPLKFHGIYMVIIMFTNLKAKQS